MILGGPDQSILEKDIARRSLFPTMNPITQFFVLGLFMVIV